jgi:hypothetical protein
MSTKLRLEWCSAASSLFSCGFDGLVRCWKVQYHGIASISLTGGASAERAKLLEGTFTLDQLKDSTITFGGKSKSTTTTSASATMGSDSGFKPSTLAKAYHFTGGSHSDVVGCFALCSYGVNKETKEPEVLLLASGGLDHKVCKYDVIVQIFNYVIKNNNQNSSCVLSH